MKKIILTIILIMVCNCNLFACGLKSENINADFTMLNEAINEITGDTTNNLRKFHSGERENQFEEYLIKYLEYNKNNTFNLDDIQQHYSIYLKEFNKNN